MGIFVFLIATLIVSGVMWKIAAENKIRRVEVKIDESRSTIDIVLIRRFDTLTKMRDICKQFATHERDTLTEITSLRSGMNIKDAKSINEKMNALQKELSIMVESYPELKSHVQYQELMKAVWEIESHLLSARKIYNSNISNYNQLLVTFPSRLVADSLGLQQMEFFETEDVHKFEDVAMN